METRMELELLAEACNHLNGNMGVTQKIKQAMQETAKQFVYIGFLLWEVNDAKAQTLRSCRNRMGPGKL